MKTLALFATALVLTRTASGAGCDNPEFAAARLQPWAAYPTSLVVTDFNGDGIADLATASDILTGIVSVALGNGDGTLRTNVDYPVGGFPTLIRTVDLRGHGTNDLVVANSNGGISVLLGRGDGTFQTNVLYGTTAPPLIAGIADINGDGKPDVVVNGGSNLNVYYGNGDGTLQFPPVVLAGVPNDQFATGDFSGNHHADIVVAEGNNSSATSIQVFFNDGSGTFTAGGGSTIGGTTPVAVVVSDFNRDGKADVAVANLDSANVVVALGQGLDQFQSSVIYPTGSQPVSLSVGDFNGDGTNDLAVANVGSNTVSVLLNQGNGTFHPAHNYETAAASIGFGDFNSDGVPDLAAGAGGLTGFANVAMLLGNGDGTFQTAPHYRTGHGPRQVLTADFNGDNKPDIATPNNFTNTISILLNNGDGTYGTNVDYIAGTNPSMIVAGDFNGDTKLDLLVANQNSAFLCLFLGNGNGTFQTNVHVGTPFLGVNFVTAGDFNHDNKLDFAIPGLFGLEVYKGNGNGTFQAAATSSSASFLDRAVGADVNKDGNLDIIEATYTGTNVLVLLGNNDGTFQTPRTNFAGTAIYDVAVGDLNGDGKLDIVTADIGCNPCNTSYPQGKVQVLLGNGNGTFQPAVGYLVDAAVGTYAVSIGDVNGDGKPDLIVANSLTPSIWVLLNNGNGTFQQGVPFRVQLNPAAMTVTDVDVDGHPDVLVANQGNDSISVLLNTCPVLVSTSSCPTITVSPTSLPAGTVGTAYSQKITAAGGQASYTFAVTTGTLPGNLNLSNAGTISGTPTNQGVFGFTITATDANLCTGQRAYTLTINANAPALSGTLSKIKDACKTKNAVTTCKLSAALAILNSGTGAALPVHIRYFLSTDATYHMGVDTLLGEGTTKAIKPGKSGKGKLKAVTSASSAGKFILAVDDNDSVLAFLQVPAL